MDDLLGLLFFGLIAVGTLVAKAFEKRKAEQQREERKGQRQTRREDLPEATRRMLYGDGAGPRTATPRTDGAPQQPRMAEPRTARPAAEPAPAPVPTRQPEAKPWTAAPDVRRQREDRMREIKQSDRGSVPRQPQALAQRQPSETVEPRIARPKSLQEAYRRQHPRQQQPEVQPERPRPRRQQRPAPQRQAAARTPQRRRASGRGQYKSELAWLFSTPKTVRHGIVMMEILGTPKGLQDL